MRRVPGDDVARARPGLPRDLLVSRTADPADGDWRPVLFRLEPGDHGRIDEPQRSREEFPTARAFLESLTEWLGGWEALSERTRASLERVGESLCGYPQLASEARFAAGQVGHVARRLLLGEPVAPFLGHIDLDALVPPGRQKTSRPRAPVRPRPRARARDPMSVEPTERFSGRVEDYVRYRPGYPDAVVDVLREEAGLSPGWVVADIGSGTGLSARPLLDRGHVVNGVEPNADMRRAAETLLAGEPGFRSVAGRAEATTLPDQGVDLIVVAQAFHWLDPVPSRREFLRILKPAGWVALVWNTRRTATTAFLRDYERLLERHGTDYARVRHDRDVRSRVASFFGGAYAERRLYNEQLLDLEGLRGRILSSSYTPAEGAPARAALERDIRRLFHDHADGSRVRIEYDVEIFVGRLSEGTEPC